MLEKLPSAKIILHQVALSYGLDNASLEGTTVKEPIRMAFYLVRKLTTLSLPEIGALFHKSKDEALSAIHMIDSLLKRVTRN